MIRTTIYKDGGTKEYLGLFYKVIKCNTLVGDKKVTIGTYFMDYNDDCKTSNGTKVGRRTDWHTSNIYNHCNVYWSKVLWVSWTFCRSDSSNYIKKTKFQAKWQDFCKEAGIDTLTTKELINHIKNGVSFKLFGALRGRGEQGELVIGNAPSKYGKPANVNGENIFRVPPKIISLLKKEGVKENDIDKYVSKIEVKNKDAAFKAKVNEAIGLGTVKENFENAFNILLEEFFM
jgi:hypothetical protein